MFAGRSHHTLLWGDDFLLPVVHTTHYFGVMIFYFSCDPRLDF
jgi:hypothetical protein